jgi:glycerol-3-phosphate acyltransferase PlsY
MEPGILLLAVLSGYLIGAISFARLITRLVAPNVDIEDVELPASGQAKPHHMRQIGATTASVKLGNRWGCTIALLDIFKVTLPTLVFKLLFPDQPYFLFTAVAGMLGHNWPVYYKFRGGGGMSAIYGGFLAVDWVGAIVCAFAGLIFGMLIIKDVLFAYISGTWLMVLWLWFRTHDLAYVIYALVVNILFAIALLPEIQDGIKARREGRADFEGGMQTFPMGRAMLKLMEKLKISKK